MNAASSHRLFLAIFVFVLAPIASVVLITAMLLFGVDPPTVFAPGFAVKSLAVRAGFAVANRVAVASTAAFWWLIVVVAGVLWDRRPRRRAP